MYSVNKRPTHTPVILAVKILIWIQNGSIIVQCFGYKSNLTLLPELLKLCLSPEGVRVFAVEILEDGPTPILTLFLLFLHYEGINILCEQS